MSEKDSKGLFSAEIRIEEQETPKMNEALHKALNRKILFLISLFAGFSLLSLFMRFLMDITGS